MKAFEIMEDLFALADAERDFKGCCDTLKAGSPDVEVQKVNIHVCNTGDCKKCEGMGSGAFDCS